MYLFAEGLRLWCLMPLSKTDSFIDGGNRSTWRKPPTCRKLLSKLMT
jgi:hypothetical protein